MRELNTFKDVAAALRDAQEELEAGKLRRVVGRWIDTSTDPMGACAAGAIAFVSGIDPNNTWSWVIRETWPVFSKVVPFQGGKDLLDVISKHNDEGESWSAIADWIERLDVEGQA